MNKLKLAVLLLAAAPLLLGPNSTWAAKKVRRPATLLPATPVKEAMPDMSATAVYVDMNKIPGKSAGYADLRVAATTEIAPASDIGAFRTVCTLSHMAKDDPIVFPGQPGRSHLHTFFGNTGANANSTAESLRTTGNSTCRGGIANRSAYWVPTLIDTKDGTPLVPVDIGTYYKTGYNLPASLIQPIPEGLRIVAGDPTRSTPGGKARFKCIGGPNKENDKYGSAIGNCDVGARLVSEVFFPQCWMGVVDGKPVLDSPDHKSHMSYIVQDQTAPYAKHCPATHPVAIPEITFNVEYLVTEKDAPLRWRLASDNYDKSLPGGYSSHGDWFNGWQKSISDAWVKNCDQAKKDCHSHLLGDGRKVF